MQKLRRNWDGLPANTPETAIPNLKKWIAMHGAALDAGAISHPATRAASQRPGL
jgi:hypothetical protein